MIPWLAWGAQRDAWGAKRNAWGAKRYLFGTKRNGWGAQRYGWGVKRYGLAPETISKMTPYIYGMIYRNPLTNCTFQQFTVIL